MSDVVVYANYTIADPAEVYATLSPEIKAPALAMLAHELSGLDGRSIRDMYEENPTGWMVPYHFSAGMSIRNLLRDRGFGEDYFNVDNLDDIYVALIEEALKLHPTI